eukprot:m.1279384 g.1279384  ORF g.1279384 m.1279384 type:complete len:551 (-) comp24767_c0_seq27:2159-3811(-)
MSHCGPAIVSSTSVDAIRLQLSLVREHFGEHCSKVVQVLLRRDQPFQRICDSTGLSAADARESTLWLIQHDIISPVESVASESGVRAGNTLYQVNPWRILIRQRIPRMLKYTNDAYGRTAEYALQTVLLHGRITLRQLVACVQAKYPDLDEMQVHAVVLDLMQNHLLMRRFGNEHPDYPVDVTSVGDGTASPRKTVLREQLRDAQEERDYFSFLEVKQGVAMATEAASPTPRPAKRARTVGMDSVTASFAGAGTGGYLVANYAQFIRCFLRDWVVDYVANKIDPVCGEIMKGIFDAVMLHPNKAGDRSKAIELRDLPRYLPPKYTVLSPSVIDRHVRLLSTFGSGVVAKMGEYIQVDYRRLRELARYTAIERVVTLKCGRDCARLFRLIYKRKFVEQKQVKDLALVGSFKEAKAQLNTLFRNQYITMQEMPKQAGDRAPSKCFYVWKCNVHHVARILVDTSYKVQANLAMRATSEQQAHDDIRRRQDKQLDPSEHADQLRANADKLSMERIAAKLDRIEKAIMEADEQVRHKGLGCCTTSNHSRHRETRC